MICLISKNRFLRKEYQMYHHNKRAWTDFTTKFRYQIKKVKNLIFSFYLFNKLDSSNHDGHSETSTIVYDDSQSPISKWVSNTLDSKQRTHNSSCKSTTFFIYSLIINHFLSFKLSSPYYLKNSNDLVAFLNQSVYKVSFAPLIWPH